jgi:hypothetical protein
MCPLYLEPGTRVMAVMDLYGPNKCIFQGSGGVILSVDKTTKNGVYTVKWDKYGTEEVGGNWITTEF